MANHNLPQITSTYQNFVTEMDARFDDLCYGLDPARTTITNLPTNSVGWSSAENKWKRWTGTAWADMATTYAISITGNAATATTLATARTINGVSFNGSANISVNTVTALTFNNAGSGDASGTTFNGSTARTISYNTVGAPSISGTNATGTWSISINGNAATVTNGVYTTGAQSIAGLKTFTDGVISSSGTSFTTSAYTASYRLNAGSFIKWDKGVNSNALGFGTLSNGSSFNWVRSTADDNSAASTNLLVLDSSGNLTATANVTAYSDERLKENWDESVTSTALVEELSKVKAGTFTRIDNQTRQIGVSAQSLQQVMPEAVLEDMSGMLSVSYGNASLVACIALAREVIELRAKLSNLEAKINGD